MIKDKNVLVVFSLLRHGELQVAPPNIITTHSLRTFEKAIPPMKSERATSRRSRERASERASEMYIYILSTAPHPIPSPVGGPWGGPRLPARLAR